MIRIGLLWFDGDPRRSFDAKIEQAAARYRVKFGQEPNVCYVHPSCLPTDAVAGAASSPAIAAGATSGDSAVTLQVRTARDILPNHFMLGRVSSM